MSDIQDLDETLGGKRVRLAFNPSGNIDVECIKMASAGLINICDGLKGRDPRLAALAMTAYEEAAMWAVKLVTTEPENGLPEPVK